MILDILLKKKTSIKRKITFAYSIKKKLNLIKKSAFISFRNFIKSHLYQYIKLT